MNSWIAFWAETSVLEVVAWIVGITTVITFLSVNWKRIFKFFQTINQLVTLTDDIAYIRKQLENNGGSTVKDAAQKAAAQGEENAEAIAEMQRSLTEVAQAASAASQVATTTQIMLAEHIRLSDRKGN